MKLRDERIDVDSAQIWNNNRFDFQIRVRVRVLASIDLLLHVINMLAECILCALPFS